MILVYVSQMMIAGLVFSSGGDLLEEIASHSNADGFGFHITQKTYLSNHKVAPPLSDPPVHAAVGKDGAVPRPQPRQYQCLEGMPRREDFEVIVGRAVCVPDASKVDPVAPEVVDEGALREAVVVRAFSLTMWAKPTVSMQPPGLKTLVNLKTFYQAGFAEAGYQPGEIHEVDPGKVLGRHVRVRPRAVGYTYHFGDGTFVGPTTSAGGVWPDGDVTHTYRKPGTYLVRVDVSYTADVSIDGGEFQPVGQTVTVPGTPETLVVKEAHTRLVRP